MNKEIWKPVPGFGGHYEASSFGRVRSKEREVVKADRYGGMMTQRYAERLLSQYMKRGYWYVRFGVNGQKLTSGVHRMVLLAFHGEPSSEQITRHLNGDPTDNRPENLAWGTHLENMADRKDHGNYFNGEDHVMAKLTEEQVLYVRQSPKTGKSLSEMLGVSQSQISRIRRNISWSHI